MEKTEVEIARLERERVGKKEKGREKEFRYCNLRGKLEYFR